MSLARILAFISFILVLPIFTEVYFLERAAKSIDLYEIYLIIRYLVYLPILFIVLGFLFREHIPKTCGVLLFIAGLVLLFFVFGYDLIYNHFLFIGIFSSMLSIVGGVLLLFDVDFYFR